jgi:MoxR-like ATPase
LEVDSSSFSDYSTKPSPSQEASRIAQAKKRNPEFRERVIELAAAHDGRMEIESVPGVGTTFAVALAAKQA